MMAWCVHYGLPARASLVADDTASIAQALADALPGCDAIITGGGAWRGERDLVAGALDRLGWQRLYHHVRLAPGKSAGFGLWQGKPVFCLPGNPPANQLAFLELALPGLLKMAGHGCSGCGWPGLPVMWVEAGEDLHGREGWTQFVEGSLAVTGAAARFHPVRTGSRLRSMAAAEALARLPEDTALIPRGARIPVQLLPGALAPVERSVVVSQDPTVAPAPAVSSAPQRVVSFVARSGAGKTTFLERLIPALVARGVRVGVLKHHAHATPFDVPGKDTYRLAQAGAAIVVGACPVQVAVFRQEDGSADLQAVIERDLAGVDLVITEGYKRGSYPKIEVHRRAVHPDLLCQPHELLGLVTDEPLDMDVPQFSLEEPDEVAGFMVEWLRG